MSSSLVKILEQPEVFARDFLDNPEERAKFLKAAEKDPVRYFCPNGPQEDMINAAVRCMQESKTPVLEASCANGVGKTTLAVHMLTNIIFGPQNGWFDFDEFRSSRGCWWEKRPKNAWYVSTAEAISGTIWPMIEQFWGDKIVARYDENKRKVDYKAIKEGKAIVSKVRLSNGWILSFKTFEQDIQTYESANVGFIVIDEPAPEEVWRACLSRRRKGCLIFLPMTPLDCPPYISEDIEKAKAEGRAGWDVLEASVYEVSTSKLYPHNGRRGHLEADIIDSIVADYSEEERDARVYGKSTYFSGRIYPEFSLDDHMVDPEKFPVTPEMDIFHVVDPHDGRPCACAYGAVDEFGRIIVFAETPETTKKPYWDITVAPPLDAEVSAWKDTERIFNLTDSNIRRVMDKKMGWQARGRRTFDELFQEHDMFFEKSYVSKGEYGEIALGHQKVKKYLKPWNKFGDKNKGVPGIVIWDTLFHVPNGMKKYIKRRRKGSDASNHAKADGVIVEKYKDFPDVIRYMVMAVIEHQEGVVSAGRNQIRNVINELDNYREEPEAQGYSTY